MAKKKPARRVPKTPSVKKAPAEDGRPSGAQSAIAWCPVAGVGASAGGVEAFSELLQGLPSDTGMAFVLIGHLDPKHPSLLSELLSKSTRMPVREIQNSMRVDPNHVYVIPPNANVSISNGVLLLEPRRVPHMPIDRFLRSLAEEQGNKAIGAILSGTASDGTLGLKAIKAGGGITFAQDEKTAKYDGMPLSAIQSGCVDFILSPEGIAHELARLCQHPYVAPPRGRESSSDDEQQFGPIFNMLRNATGVDFVYYKHATIRRRIMRRMALHKLEQIGEYIEYIGNNPAELSSLFQDILINVTSFFREPATFDALKVKVLPLLLKNRGADDPLRVWVPGCATGEDAYSVAICLVEYLRENDLDTPIQVFGTDLSDNSLERARSGVYPESIAADVSPERLRRFFHKVNGSYQISRSIRDMCIFARQNLTKDPPFSKLDIITCRNVLIYLGPILQAKVIRYFHYGLKSGGYLILGQSESVGSNTDLFGAIGGKDKIYAKKVVPHAVNLDVGTFEERRSREGIERVQDWVSGSDPQKKVDQLILANYSPPGVVVDEELKVLQFRGHTAPFLEHNAGQPSLSLLKMMRGGLGLEVRKLIERVKKTGMPVTGDSAPLASSGGTAKVVIGVTPIKGPHSGDRAFFVVFETYGAEKAPRRAVSQKQREKDGSERADELEQELAATKQYLQTVIEEQEASREELQSAHEEVQSSNEELQSTNEELLTSKEELQSTNEELNTVNEEMQGRNTELTQINNDLNNLLSSVNIPIVMLGNDLRVRRFTPQAEKVLNLLPTDVGRKVTDFRIKINIPDVESLFLDVIEHLHTKEREVTDEAGHTYLMSIRPYRTGDNKIDGAVMTLFDITERNHAELRYRRMFEASTDGIAILERATGVILDVNPVLTRLSNYSRDQAIGRQFRELGFFPDGDLPDVSNLSDGDSVQRTLVLQDGTGKPVDVDVVAAAHIEGSKLVVQLNFRDIGSRLLAERHQKEEETEQRQSEKLDAVARLAGGMAHDLNNVLTTIVGYSDLLKSRLTGNAALLKDLEEIRRGGDRATGLVRQLLAFGHKQVRQPRLIDANSVLADLDQVLRLMFDDRIQFTVNAKSTSAVMADPRELEQILTILVMNARDAMPDGGNLTIDTADAGDMVMISVTDSGTGMDDETKSHLFQPFFSTKARGMGAGLGLVTIHNAVQSLHGEVRIQSRLGEGTTVQVLLPHATEGEVPAAETPDSGGTETVLVVEDEPAIRRLAATVLRERGYRVIEAANGSEALRAARGEEGAIQLLLANVVMPRMSGREVADRLRSARPDMKILFMSGHAEDTIVDHGVLEPGFAFLPKPFTPKTLSAKVRAVLDGVTV